MPDIFFCTAFRRDAFPGRRWLTVLPGISSGGSILSSGFPVFFFRAHAAAGGTGSAPGFRFRGSVKAAAHWQTPARFIAAGIFPANRQKPRNCLQPPPRPLRTGQRYFLRLQKHTFRQAVPDGLTREYCQAEKILLMG